MHGITGAEPEPVEPSLAPAPVARAVRRDDTSPVEGTARALLRQLGAEAVCIHLLDEGGALVLSTAAGLEPGDAQALRRLAPEQAGALGRALMAARPASVRTWEVLGPEAETLSLRDGCASTFSFGPASSPVGVATAFWIADAGPPDDLGSGCAALDHFAEGLLAARALHPRASSGARQRTNVEWIFERAPDAIVVLDDEARYVDANPAALRLLGRPSDELLGRQFLEFTLPADRRRLDRLFRTLLKRSHQEGSAQLLRPDGSVRMLEFSAVSHALPGRHLAIMRDVTNRRRAEEALRRSERSLARAQKMARLGHWEWDAHSREVRWSRQTSRILGHLPNCARPGLVTFLHAVPPRDRRRVLRAIRGTITEGRPYDIVHRIVRRDGSERIIHAMADVVLDSTGRAVEVLGTVHDVTEQRQAEEMRERLLRELESERSWLRAVIDHSPAGILLIEGPRGERITANERALGIFGTDELGSRSSSWARERIRRADGTRFTAEDVPTARALRGEVITGEELVVLGADGTPVPVLASSGPIHQAGRLVGAVLVLEDITPIKELQRMRDEWTSLIAHDLRQPLTVIDGHATLLVRQALRQAPVLASRAEHILTSARNLRRMVSDLLEISRIEARRLELRCVPTDLCRLVSNVVDRLRPVADSAAIRVVNEESIDQVLADPVRLEQALANLISNALKYSFEGTDIVIDLSRTADEVMVSVTNQGEGIRPEELPHLFTRFHRTETARRGRTRGIGLGLHITRGLIEAHGGRIWAESEPGASTTFRFTLPLCPAQEKAPQTDGA